MEEVADDCGVSLTEYMLMAALVIMSVLWFSQSFVGVLQNSYQNHNDAFDFTNTPTMVPEGPGDPELVMDDEISL